MKVIDIIKKALWFIVLLILLYLIQHFVNFLTYDNNGPSTYLIKFFSPLGIQEEFIRFALWYVYQIIITFICFKLFFRKSLKELGFNFQNYKMGIKYISLFLIAYTLINAIACLIIYKLSGVDLLIAGLTNKPLSYIIQDILLYGTLPGLGEEPLFRVFVIQFLLITIFKGKDLSDKNTRIWIVIISAICFTYGHIYIVSWAPFRINYSVIQLFTAFALGIFYAITYIKTKSILAAVVCHNYSDFIYKLGSYMIFYLMK